MPYAWGSRTAIASLTGRPTPSSGPEAELWMGAHPRRSILRRARRHRASLAGDRRTRAGARARRGGRPRARTAPAFPPQGARGGRAALAPGASDDGAGARGLRGRGATRHPARRPNRNYKDRIPQARAAVRAHVRSTRCRGFRSIDETLGSSTARPSRARSTHCSRSEPHRMRHGLAETFRALMTMPRRASRKASSTRRSRRARAPSEAFTRERALAARLAELYPGDIGIVSALLLELVHLEPGRGHLSRRRQPARVPRRHRHRDHGELRQRAPRRPDEEARRRARAASRARLRRRPGPASWSARAIDEHESVYDTPAREFRLSRLTCRRRRHSYRAWPGNPPHDGGRRERRTARARSRLGRLRSSDRSALRRRTTTARRPPSLSRQASAQPAP